MPKKVGILQSDPIAAGSQLHRHLHAIRLTFWRRIPQFNLFLRYTQ